MTWAFVSPAPGARSLPVDKSDYDKLIENLKKLTAGNQDIPSYFVLKASEKIYVLISVKDMGAIRCGCCYPSR